MAAPREPREVKELYDGVTEVLNAKVNEEDENAVGDCRCGVYLFLDYDGEPIYVGKTREGLRARIRRHLTNQRTDAVAMHVLDPFEVAAVRMWPFWDLEDEDKKVQEAVLQRAEFAVFQQALADSEFNAVLNERKVPEPDELLEELPESLYAEVLPGDLRKRREHPDIMLARRAHTIAELARVISERRVTSGIRRTLLAQAQRLQHLAEQRLADFE